MSYAFTYITTYLLYYPSGPFVNWLVGWSIRQTFLKEQKDTPSCSHRSTLFLDPRFLLVTIFAERCVGKLEEEKG